MFNNAVRDIIYENFLHDYLSKTEFKNYPEEAVYLSLIGSTPYLIKFALTSQVKNLVAIKFLQFVCCEKIKYLNAHAT